MISFQPGIRFGTTSKPEPFKIDPAFKTLFLGHFTALAQTTGLQGGSPHKDNFTQTWAKEPQQAITLFGEVVDKTIQKLGQSPMAERLKQFLSFARREFGFLKTDEVTPRFQKEFRDLIRRDDEETKAAERIGLNPVFGFFRTFFGENLEQPGIREKMLAAIAEVQK